MESNELFPNTSGPNMFQLKDKEFEDPSIQNKYYIDEREITEQESKNAELASNVDEVNSIQKNKKKKNSVLYCCNFPGCEGSFTTQANRKRHERLHCGDKPFKCDFEACNKCFARKYDLKVHMRTHTKEKPYDCTVTGCNKKFSRNSSLREHERNIHHFTSLPRTRSLPQQQTETLRMDPTPHISLSLPHQDVNVQQREEQSLEQGYINHPFSQIEAQKYAMDLQIYQRFQEQKMFELRYHEQRLAFLRQMQQVSFSQLPITPEYKSRVNDLVTRFLSAQQQGIDFKLADLPKSDFTKSDSTPKLFDDGFQGQSVPPSVAPSFHSHVNSLMEDEEKNGQPCQIWDDFFQSFFPSPNSNQTM